MVLETTSSNAGIDWVTATQVKKDGEPYPEGSELEQLYKMRRRKDGEITVRFGGYKGLSDGDGLKVAVRRRKENEDVILVASGERANGVAGEVAWLDSVKVTRLDIQATVVLPERRNIAALLREETLEGRESGKAVHRRAITYYSSETGDTLYIGKRASKGKCIRVYDKGGELGQEKERTWRFEVEYHKDLAGNALEKMAKGGCDAKLIGATVASEMAKVGLIVQGLGRAIAPVPCKEEYNQERVIAWLELCVRPVLAKLAAKGALDEGLTALGLERRNMQMSDKKVDPI